jgi:hypothetical protein
MKTLTAKTVALGLCLGTVASVQAATTTVAVLPTATSSLLTVPAHRSAVVRSVVVSNPGNAAVCTQQVLNGTSIKTDLCIPAGSSFQIEFSPALFYKAGASIDLKNGDATTTTNFTVNYRVIAPGRGLIDKEE